MQFSDKKLFLRTIALVYIIFSLPAVFYAGYKTLRKIYYAVTEYRNFTYDFDLINESGGGGGRTLLIAHAGGALFADDGEMLTYTNSLEAIEQNYRRGHRVFEIDFLLTKDGQLAAVHDWDTGKRITKSDWKDAPALADWKSKKIYGKYTPIDINDIVKLMETYRDIYIVTDTKETGKNIVIKQFMEIYKAAEQIDIEILDRFIPQIYYPRMLETIYSIYEFKNVIYTLYQSPQTDAAVIDFVKNHDSIFAVTMWPERAAEDFIRQLNESNKLVYVHTVNRFEEAYNIMKSGVYGLYTDYLY